MVNMATRFLVAPCRRVRSSVLAGWALVALAGIATPAQADTGSDSRERVLKQAIVAFAASALTMRETSVSRPAHIEVLLAVQGRGEGVHPHHLPGWLKVSLDALPPVEHTYPDSEWHALADGAMHLLLRAPATPGSRTLTVHFKGIDRNGKPYLRTKAFSFDASNASDHRVLRFRAVANDDPAFSLETLGESLLRSPPTGPAATDELLYRIGQFESASGNHATAAAYYLAGLDPALGGGRQAEIRLGLAEAYAEVGAPEEAESLLERVAADGRSAALRARAWLLIERIASREGRHRRVLEAHARIGSALPADLVGEAHSLAGLSALALRAYPEAEGFFRAVPKSSPDAPLAQFGHAQALAGQGDAFTAGTLFVKLGETRSLFNPVQSRVSDYAHAALGLQLVAQGRYAEAISQLGRVPTGHPLSETTHFAIGWCLRETGEHVKAIAVFDALLIRDPEGRYSHEARLATAASYADLRATTRSVAAYRAALDALGASSVALDRVRDAVQTPTWDPLGRDMDALPVEARRAALEDPAVARALKHYRWLIRFGQELQRTLDQLSSFSAGPQASATLGDRLQTVDGPYLVNQGRDLMNRLDVVKKESRRALSALVVQAVAREQERIEEWSVAASLGIARNLRDDVSGEVLSLD